jgi:predicted GNAT family N-acyltransferase
MHEQNKPLIDLLNQCAAECNHCATACLEEKDISMLSRCIKLDMDCAEICRLAISFVARGSEHAEHVLNECAEICNACADECEKHAAHMEHCKRCAEICRECAEACHSGIAA